MMTITIYDAAGNIVYSETSEAQIEKYPGQINEMVALVNDGCPAFLAAILTEHQPATKEDE